MPSHTQLRKNARNLALANLGVTNAREVVLDNVIHAHVDRVLAATDDNLSLTADILGMHRRSLQRMQKRRKQRRKKGKHRRR